ncbi:MAG: bifunctional adenosylcobinamide kinase/adenosylcobinamide-phosphate guanylyltransferase [Tannerellaceae bacterium]|jgi:adenosylcobinamide kinase/adenosylcobinamide-phosphate guanylyltransferase|nr:bifunctional adenosylcobinamide kinase/adenosylcobinamide-phosphate guanylyltransferase [Tannerellaceae bacterium]
MDKKIILITGGQRSGKSRYAQTLALSLTDEPVYMATSRVWDAEHAARIKRHRDERGPQWTTIEEQKELGRHDLSHRVVVVDCVTLWATNYFFDLHSDADKALAEMKAEFGRLTLREAVFILVTNEIGMGEMSQNDLQRKFAGLQGLLNQYIASKADEVFLMLSGIPLKIK